MKHFEYMRVIVEAGVSFEKSEYEAACFKCGYNYFCDSLAEWGRDGWELISHTDNDGVEVHMFKRELDPIAATAPTLEI